MWLGIDIKLMTRRLNTPFGVIYKKRGGYCIVAVNEGYIRVYAPEHYSADVNGLVYEHQMVAEKKIGRPLKDREVVHHIDGNRANNSQDNLLVFASNSEHIAFHHGGAYTVDDEGIAHCKALKFIDKTC